MGDKIATRVAYGKALLQLGMENPHVMAIDADLACCTMSKDFAGSYPERFFNAGIAECNMAGMAAGMASTGKTVFIHSFAMFAAGRAYDQVRNSICYPRLNVKVVGTHAGLSIGEDGATHQCLEDLSLMRTIPNMVVVNPCDANETALAVKAIAEYEGPCYLRLGRLPVETVTSTPEYDFQLGKGVILRQGEDAAIIATGLMVQEALKAALVLEKEGVNVRVVDMHTIKPLDEELVVRCARETGAIVTTEVHNIIGGLGAAVCETVCQSCQVPVVRHGVKDIFGKSGEAGALMKKYHMCAEDISQCVKEALGLKMNCVPKEAV